MMETVVRDTRMIGKRNSRNFALAREIPSAYTDVYTHRTIMAKKLSKQPVEAKALISYKMLERRIAGVSARDISLEFGYSTGEVNKLLNEATADLNKDCQELLETARQIEIMRLDAIVNAHWDFKLNPRSADILLKISDRRAKLLGLDVPQTDISDAATALRAFVSAARDNVGITDEPLPPPSEDND